MLVEALEKEFHGLGELVAAGQLTSLLAELPNGLSSEDFAGGEEYEKENSHLLILTR